MVFDVFCGRIRLKAEQACFILYGIVDAAYPHFSRSMLGCFMTLPSVFRVESFGALSTVVFKVLVSIRGSQDFD
jgi:hypothetical protein